jgi:hypothetical protein
VTNHPITATVLIMATAGLWCIAWRWQGWKRHCSKIDGWRYR